MILPSKAKLYRRLLPMAMEMTVKPEGTTWNSAFKSLDHLEDLFNTFAKTDDPLMNMSDMAMLRLSQYLGDFPEAQDIFTEAELEKLKKIKTKHDRQNIDGQFIYQGGSSISYTGTATSGGSYTTVPMTVSAGGQIMMSPPGSSVVVTPQSSLSFGDAVAMNVEPEIDAEDNVGEVPDEQPNGN